MKVLEGSVMHLKKSPRPDGRIYLSAVHGYREPNSGKTKMRTIQSFGYVDKLKEQYDDPIAHFGKVVAAMEAERIATQGVFEIRIDPNSRLEKGTSRKNFGFVALSTIYHELGLDWFFNNRRSGTAATYNLSSIFKLLVYGRILDPGSKQRTYRRREGYFERFDFSLDDVYRALTDLALLSEDIQLFLHERISKLYGRSTELVYYDVTNYYFESDATSTLREKGYSKENRADPIIQMGLLIDRCGIPITFDLFKGNTVDCQTLLPVLSRIKHTFGLDRIVVVADKGLNTSDNIAYNLIKGDGYLFSKSVRKADKELRSWTCERKGYRKSSEDTFTKSRIAKRRVYLEGPDGKTKPVPIEEKQVAVWSRKYARRQAKKREGEIEKAKMLIDDVARFDKATHSGAARFVKGLVIDKKTGEILEGKVARSLDTKRIEQEASLDGFYILTTSEMKKTSKELVSLYSGLWKIEDCFKVTKSDLRSRPVYLSRDDHIAAHFLTCFMALTLLRILEMKIEHKYPAPQLIDAMRRCSASHLEDNVWVFDYTSDVLEDIGSAVGIDFSRKYLRKREIVKTIGDSKKKQACPQQV